MTRAKDSSPRRLPQEVELQAKREELLNGLRSLEKSGEVNPYNSEVITTPSIYFSEGSEVFGLSFIRRQHTDSAGTISVERIVEISPFETTRVNLMKRSGEVAESYLSSQHYDPPITFRLLKVNENGDINIFNASEEVATEQLDNLTSIIDFMNANVSSGSSSKNTIKDIPETLRKMVAGIRETPRMRFEYKKPEFYKALRRVEDKATKLDPPIKKSGYEEGKGVILASTGWIKVEKDGEVFELKFNTEDNPSNGGYQESDDIYRREIGESGIGRYLFGSSDLEFLTPRPIKTVEELQECIDTLEFLDRNIPASAVSSS